MKKLIIGGVLALSIAIVVSGVSASDSLVYEYRYFISAPDPQGMINAVRVIAVENGGYAKYFSDQEIIIRIPQSRLERIKNYCAENGYIIDEQHGRSDLGEKLLELKTRLVTKKDLLGNLNDILVRAKLQQSIDIQSEIMKVIEEIEGIKGQIAYYRDRVALAEVHIRINAAARSSIEKKKSETQWNWIRYLGIEQLLRGF